MKLSFLFKKIYIVIAILIISILILSYKIDRYKQSLENVRLDVRKCELKFEQHLNPDLIPYEQVDVLNFITKETISAGSKEMASHKVVIVGISRDNIHDLTVVIKNIENIGKKFADYRVIIFENDSTDGTKIALKNWRLSNEKIKIINKDYNIKKRPNIKFMADARNHYIEALKSSVYAEFDIVMVIDMDMSYGVDVRGIQDSFSKISKWDAVCSNGIFTKEGKMWDAFAFRNEEFPLYSQTKDYWTSIVPKIQRVYKPESELMPVYSCFGGMAFYKKESIKGCVYDSINDDCEHVIFHKCLIEKNKGKMFMNPAQIIRYSHYKDNK